MTSPGTPPARTRRLLFVDRLRGWAVLVMIEVHVVNALLRPDLRRSDFFVCLNFINGLVAPAFIFCAGFAFALSAKPKWEQYVYPSSVFLKYLKRLGFIFLVAYSLHVPFFSLRKMLAQTDEATWTSFFQSGVLQAIAASLLLLLLLVPLIRSKKFFAPAIAVIGAAIVFLSPIVAVAYFPNAPWWLRGFLSERYDSGFPLFPWSAFALFGAVCGILYSEFQVLGRRKLMRQTVFGSLLLGVISVGAQLLPVSIYPAPDYWFATPQFFFLRLAFITGLCALLLKFEPDSDSVSSRAVLPAPILLFGRESMLVYVAHLLAVYGNKVELSYAQYFGPTLDYFRCACLYLVLATAMYLLAAAWDGIKRWRPDAAKVFQYAFICTCIVIFCMKKF